MSPLSLMTAPAAVAPRAPSTGAESPPHLAFVTTFYYPRMRGGAEHSLQHHAETLVKRGLRVSVLSLHDGAAVERFTHHGVECHAFPATHFASCLNLEQRPPALTRALWHLADVYNASAARLLERELRSIAPDLVQTENLPGWSCAAWDGIRRAGIPHVQMLHDFQLTCPKATRFKGGKTCAQTCAACRPFAWLPRRLSQRVRHVVANSRYTRDVHRSLGFFPRAETFDVVYGAVPASSVPPAAPTAPSALRLGYLGRLHPTKGVGLLIEALRAAGRHDVLLRIAGSGTAEYERELTAAARGLPVQFLGTTPAPQFLRTIDVLVVPSLWDEPMGRVVVEAAAQGVPVLASRRGGIPELVREGETGWIFDPSSPEELAQHLRQLTLEQTRGCHDACRSWGESFAAEPVADRWLEIYARILTRAGKGRGLGLPIGEGRS